MTVSFTNSGTIILNSNYDNIAKSGILSIVNTDNNSILSTIPFPITSSNPSINYFLDSLHTSKDDYYINVGAFGYRGEGRICTGLSPTSPVLVEGFNTDYFPVSGVQILYKDFEDASISGLTLLVTGTGITSSGLTYDTTMEGNYFLGMQSSSDASLHIIPTDLTASGMLSGRTIFLVKNGTLNATSQQTVGFAFLLQGSTLTSNCYKVYMTTDTDGYQYRIDIKYGQLANGTTGVIDSVGEVIASIPIEYYTTTIRNIYKRHWIMIEWEVDTSLEENIKIAVYHKRYESGDTKETVRTTAKLIQQSIWTGTYNPGFDGLYTTTTQPVRWIVSSDGSVATGIDCIYLESIDHVIDRGIFNSKFKMIQGTESSSRITIENYLYCPGRTTELQGLHLISGDNPLVDNYESIFSMKGQGYSGPSAKKTGGSVFNYPFLSFVIDAPGANGIRCGVFRIGLKIHSNVTNNGTKLGFSFLRQGSVFSSNCYTMEFYRSGTNAFNIRIKKGIIITTPYGGTTTFGGSTLGTSSSIPGLNDSASIVWVEIRWRTNISSTEIEVLTCPMSLGIIETDYSPGNIDSRLTSLLTVTDGSSPYLSSSDLPIVTMVSDDTLILYQMELRRAKIGN